MDYNHDFFLIFCTFRGGGWIAIVTAGENPGPGVLRKSAIDALPMGSKQLTNPYFFIRQV